MNVETKNTFSNFKSNFDLLCDFYIQQFCDFYML